MKYRPLQPPPTTTTHTQLSALALKPALAGGRRGRGRLRKRRLEVRPKHGRRALALPTGLAPPLAAIEVKLRQLRFRQYNEFVPTAHQMTLNEHAFYEAMRGDELKHYPGEYAEIAYSINEGAVHGA